MSHTPGPWKVGEKNCRVICEINSEPFVSMAEDVCILTADDHQVLGSSEWLNVEPDNLRLIAAAPELLDALKALLVMMDREQPRKIDAALSWRANDEHARALAASAIAKAEGR